MRKTKSVEETGSVGDHSGVNGDAPSKKTTVTFHIPATLEKNVAVHCALHGVSKTKFITDVLAEKIETLGYKPFDEPKIGY